MTQSQLTELENIIFTHRRNFYKIGKALKRIRDEKLFRDLLFNNFEEYVKERWDMARSHAYRLIEASTVMDNLSPIGDKILPDNESQARALARFKKNDQRKIWKEFISSGITMSAENIRKFANKQIKKPITSKKPRTSDMVNIISPSYHESVMTMLEQIRLAQNDNWENTSKEAALFWVKIMKEKIISNLYYEKK